MEIDYEFEPADSVMYSEWLHRKSWKLQEASWLLAGYVRGNPIPFGSWSSTYGYSDANAEVNRYESALRAGVKQEKCGKTLKPSEWITFAHKRGLPVPPALAKFFPDGTSIFEHCAKLESELSKLRPVESSNTSRRSDNLVYVNQAAAKFWANANQSDPSTHPSNATVTDWLIQRGFSQALAKKAATIIRPKWAAIGRKPKE